ncbi:DUF6507 family protein [Actinomadura verrucosospora]|uniref:Uncharacterized protein n=1 Tax=Actinomadura verrucosospora TaxID=46165 RepID=A0A7D3VV20_ACTVE|nr:DUF6507 family protein [Actinomadura verrucosospora]QKG23458.1 hypothetical protein ACTIVE_5101 [Actinomadura verrucosospora]
MTAYKIDLPGVFGELTKVQGAVEPLWDVRKAYFQHLADAASGSHSDIVAGALERFGEATARRWNGAAVRVNRALVQTAKAARFYDLADQEMGERARSHARRAAAAQRKATLAPKPSEVEPKK